MYSWIELNWIELNGMNTMPKPAWPWHKQDPVISIVTCNDLYKFNKTMVNLHIPYPFDIPTPFGWFFCWLLCINTHLTQVWNVRMGTTHQCREWGVGHIVIHEAKPFSFPCLSCGSTPARAPCTSLKSHVSAISILPSAHIYSFSKLLQYYLCSWFIYYLRRPLKNQGRLTW